MCVSRRSVSFNIATARPSSLLVLTFDFRAHAWRKYGKSSGLRCNSFLPQAHLSAAVVVAQQLEGAPHSVPCLVFTRDVSQSGSQNQLAIA